MMAANSSISAKSLVTSSHSTSNPLFLIILIFQGDPSTETYFDPAHDFLPVNFDTTCFKKSIGNGPWILSFLLSATILIMRTNPLLSWPLQPSALNQKVS